MKFSFLDWMGMNMIVDIAFLVFAGAVVWKVKRLQKTIASVESYAMELEKRIAYHKVFCQDLAKRIDVQTGSILELSQDVEITMRNPAEARRLFKERQKRVIIDES
tara:strand:+ start:173 stop:490 length:318 start_codon:yes stop_codon:yes gene_type:complete